MAQKRMFSLKIVDTDEFLDMPPTTQNLYFHLCMRADDDGFVSNPKKIMKIVNSAADDMKVLTAKSFVIPFESGICVIKHWKIHNLIRADRYIETEYKKEKKLLKMEDKKYELDDGMQNDIPNGNPVKVRLDKVSIGKVSLNKLNKEGGEFTPSKEMNLFLEDNGNYFNELLQSIVEKTGILEDSVRKELISFISYWTERNKSGTKQRWELEKTFELKRRLNTWFRNAGKFNSTKGKGKTILT